MPLPPAALHWTMCSFMFLSPFSGQRQHIWSFADRSSISTYKLGHIFASWKPTHGKCQFLKHCSLVRRCNGFHTVIWGTVFSLKSPPWLSVPASLSVSVSQRWHAWIQMLWDPDFYCWILPVSRLRAVSSDRTLGQWDSVPGKQRSTVQYLHTPGPSLST